MKPGDLERNEDSQYDGKRISQINGTSRPSDMETVARCYCRRRFEEVASTLLVMMTLDKRAAKASRATCDVSTRDK